MQTKRLVGYGIGSLVSLIVGSDSIINSSCRWPCHMECSPRRCECICPSEPEEPYYLRGNGEEYSSTKLSSNDNTDSTNLRGSIDEPRLIASVFKIDYKN